MIGLGWDGLGGLGVGREEGGGGRGKGNLCVWCCMGWDGTGATDGVTGTANCEISVRARFLLFGA